MEVILMKFNVTASLLSLGLLMTGALFSVTKQDIQEALFKPQVSSEQLTNLWNALASEDQTEELKTVYNAYLANKQARETYEKSHLKYWSEQQEIQALSDSWDSFEKATQDPACSSMQLTAMWNALDERIQTAHQERFPRALAEKLAAEETERRKGLQVVFHQEQPQAFENFDNVGQAYANYVANNSKAVLEDARLKGYESRLAQRIVKNEQTQREQVTKNYQVCLKEMLEKRDAQETVNSIQSEYVLAIEQAEKAYTKELEDREPSWLARNYGKVLTATTVVGGLGYAYHSNYLTKENLQALKNSSVKLVESVTTENAKQISSYVVEKAQAGCSWLSSIWKK